MFQLLAFLLRFQLQLLVLHNFQGLTDGLPLGLSIVGGQARLHERLKALTLQGRKVLDRLPTQLPCTARGAPDLAGLDCTAQRHLEPKWLRIRIDGMIVFAISYPSN